MRAIAHRLVARRGRASRALAGPSHAARRGRVDRVRRIAGQDASWAMCAAGMAARHPKRAFGICSLSMKSPETYALRLATVIDGALSSGPALHAHGPVRFLQECAHLLMPKKGRK
ncbi:hypothetical protein [Burkholderia sp. USMB20]|uniref:hypothetical protein n=1 Tax=Burkholderia sp. USMB20 TaxID=1571773 RepID=UPI001F40BBF2|nr:hypothetical protein [Burkholderia sp. USMB20]